jgi:hypothetical protein
MQDQAEQGVKRLERLGKLLTGAVIALIICVVLLLVLDFAP